MFNIIQTIHHNDGLNPESYWYNSFDNLRSALDYCHMLNAYAEKKNQDETVIPVTYCVKYHAA